MRTLTALDQALWIGGLSGHMCLISLLIWRRWYRAFPSFLAYVVLEASSTVLLFYLRYHASKHAYFLAYWITGYAEYPVQFWLLFDISRDLLAPVKKRMHELRYNGVTWGLLFAITFAVLAIGVSPAGVSGFDLWENRISVFTSLTLCAAIVAVSFGTNHFGLERRTHSVGLGVGVFIWSYSVLLNDLAHAITRWNSHLILIGYLREFTYLGALLYLVLVFWRKETTRPPLSPEMMRYMSFLHNQVEVDLGRLEGPR